MPRIEPAQRHSVLEGIRIIDLTTVLAGPGATQILGDMGADVIKVEPPFGDETRRMGAPAYHDGSAGSYVNVNRNKKSISLDLKKKEGQDILLKLLENADVLIGNFKPGTLEKWDLGYEEVLKKRFPQLIYCQVSAFGNDGPLGGIPGYDPLAQAYGGIVSLGGFADGNPMRVNIPVVDWTSALYAVIAIQGALIERSHSGQGQAVEVTLYDAALSLLHPFACNWLLNGTVARPMGNRHPSIAPYDIYPTRDGHIIVMANNQRQFEALCDAMNLAHLKMDERLQTSRKRAEQVEFLTSIFSTAFMETKTSEIVERLTRVGVPIAPVLDIGEALSHPHVHARGDIVEGDNGYRGIASPVRLSRTPVTYRLYPPTHGEHTKEVLADIGFDEDQIARLIENKTAFG